MNSEYILMCKESVELQGLWDTAPGSKYYHERFGYGHINYEFATDQSEYVWLPTQEDLQKICKNKLEDILSVEMALFEHFMNWLFRFVCFRNGCESTTEYFYRNGQVSYCTINEAWLLFTMEKCFHKVWNFETKQWTEIT